MDMNWMNLGFAYGSTGAENSAKTMSRPYCRAPIQGAAGDHPSDTYWPRIREILGWVMTFVCRR
jgi:hypothetical protein